MPVEKVTFRLSPMNITRANEATFQTLYEARVDRPLDDIDLNEVFQNVNSLLRVGDAVNFCAYDGKMEGPEAKLRQVRVCRVTFKGQDAPGGQLKIRAAWVGEVQEIKADPAIAFAKKPTLKLEAKKQFGGGYHVVDEKGHVIEAFKGEGAKEQADAYIARLADPSPPIPPATEAPKAKPETKPAAA